MKSQMGDSTKKFCWTLEINGRVEHVKVSYNVVLILYCVTANKSVQKSLTRFIPL